MEKNKMAVVPLKKLFLKMGLPMIISMVLQALYNVIDSIFITNMGSDGVIANQALTLAFPIQLLIIAIGVGTGVGINALLSKSLGEQNKDKVNKIAGTGIFLSICIYVVFFSFFLLFSCIFIFSSIFFDFILFLETHRRFSPTTCFTVLRTVLFPSDHRSFKAFAKTFWLFSGRRLFAFISSCTAFHLLW